MLNKDQLFAEIRSLAADIADRVLTLEKAGHRISVQIIANGEGLEQAYAGIQDAEKKPGVTISISEKSKI